VINWKEWGGNSCAVFEGTVSGVHLNYLRKTTRGFQNRWYSGRDSNRPPLEYKSDVLRFLQVTFLVTGGCQWIVFEIGDFESVDLKIVNILTEVLICFPRSA
jgi:hypothetical protein